MKMLFGAIVVDGRNKIGGHVASKNRAGAYLRTKVTPVNPSSTAQVTVRSDFAANAQGWRGLTDAQRAAWNAAVEDFKRTDIFGSIKTPSGFNLYVRLNSQLAAINIAAITAPPLPGSVSIFESLVVVTVNDSGTITLTAAPATIPADESVIVRATPALSAGKSFVKSEFRQIQVLTALIAGAIDLSAAWAAKFGAPPAAGSKIFIEFIHVNELTGQASQAQQISAIVSEA